MFQGVFFLIMQVQWKQLWMYSTEDCAYIICSKCIFTTELWKINKINKKAQNLIISGHLKLCISYFFKLSQCVSKWDTMAHDLVVYMQFMTLLIYLGKNGYTQIGINNIKQYMLYWAYLNTFNISGLEYGHQITFHWTYEVNKE